MHKILILLLAVFITSLGYAQTDSLTKQERLALDSMFKNDEFIKLMMGQAKKKSYVDICVNVGNQLLSTTNNNANAGGLQSRFTLIPTVGYYHKSGFGLNLSAFFASDSGSFKPYQYAANPYFEYNGKSIYVGVSYVRYISDKSSGFSPNPFQNSYYANFLYTKPFVEPGISIGYAGGNFTDTVTVLNTIKKVKVRLSDFSIAPYVQHTFYFYKLFVKRDKLQFSPSILLIAGRQKIDVPGLNKGRLLQFPRLRNSLKNRFEADSKFQLQSAAASIAMKYSYKKFYVSPDFYIDYYLPSTAEKKLTMVFSVTTGFSF